MEVSEFVDNSLRALDAMPAGHPGCIDVWVAKEALDNAGGMTHTKLENWAARGSIPKRHKEVRACQGAPRMYATRSVIAVIA
jgi:hypothetical protein